MESAGASGELRSTNSLTRPSARTTSRSSITGPTRTVTNMRAPIVNRSITASFGGPRRGRCCRRSSVGERTKASQTTKDTKNAKDTIDLTYRLAWPLLAAIAAMVAGCTAPDRVAVTDPSWADQYPHKSDYVIANGVRLNYLDWGGQGPV